MVLSRFRLFLSNGMESNDSVCMHACVHKRVSVGLSVFVLYVCHIVLYLRIQWNLFSGHHWDPGGCAV